MGVLAGSESNAGRFARPAQSNGYLRRWNFMSLRILRYLWRAIFLRRFLMTLPMHSPLKAILLLSRQEYTIVHPGLQAAYRCPTLCDRAAC